HRQDRNHDADVALDSRAPARQRRAPPMKTFTERLREDRRLVMLRLLAESPGYRMNSSNLHAGLHHLAVACTRDDVATDLAWLREQSMVLLDAVPEVPGLSLV